jgi:hypothetical protein
MHGGDGVHAYTRRVLLLLHVLGAVLLLVQTVTCMPQSCGSQQWESAVGCWSAVACGGRGLCVLWYHHGGVVYDISMFLAICDAWYHAVSVLLYFCTAVLLSTMTEVLSYCCIVHVSYCAGAASPRKMKTATTARTGG